MDGEVSLSELYTDYIMGNPQATETVERLKDIMTDGGTVFIGGCNAGSDPSVQKDLERLSEVLSVNIISSTGRVSPHTKSPHNICTDGDWIISYWDK